MSNIAKLKKQAAEFETKKQFDKALAIYVKVLEAYDQFPEEVELALFNRVGDLQLRQGNVADAVDYYERAVDKYADGGFFNNAIALCNKILRQSPGRASVYYKLGKISAQKGFKADAKQNFLEYAERMQKSGNMDEAFRALKEFADLCPDQDDIRLMLADQLTKLDRKAEAIEQLQTLHERYESEGRSAEASATASRLRSLDPSIEPRSSQGRRKAASDDLIFIDLGEPAPRISRSQRVIEDPLPPPVVAAPPVVVAPPIPPRAAPTPVASHDPIFLDLSSSSTPTPTVLDVIPTDAGASASAGGDATVGGMLGLESTDMGTAGTAGTAGAGLESAPPPMALEFEATSLTSDVPTIDAQPAEQELPLLDLGSSTVPELLDLGTSNAPELLDLGTSSAPELLDLGTSSAPELLDLGSSSAPELLDLGSPSSGPELLDLGVADFDELSPVEPPSVPRRLTLTPRSSARAIDGLPMMDLDEPTPSATPSQGVPSTAPANVASDISGLTLRDAVNEVDRDDQKDSGSELVMLSLDDEPSVPEEVSPGAPMAVPRSSTLFAAQSVAILEAAVEGEPNDWSLRRELAEAMLEAGNRSGGLAQLEIAMQGAEDANDLALAGSLADELARLEPDVVKHHQKRVEFAFRRNDRGRLVESYLALADVLLRSDQAEKARTVYERVLNLDPAEARASAALKSLPVVAPPAPPPEPKRTSSRISTAKAAPAPSPAANPVSAANDFVNLGDWLRDDEAPKDTRMVVEEKEPTGDENADFADMLSKFKQGVAANVDAEDYQSHYDLAIAYKEMGLIDEAISGFQRALGAPTNRLPTYEALGQCFIEKGQYRMASSILQRGLAERGAKEDQLVGVLYLLGRAAEALDKKEEAIDFYQRVFVIDIQFKDVADRLANVERAAR